MELLVAEAQVGRGVYDGGVTSFPVWTSAPGVRGMRTGAGVHVGVAERAGSPVVGELMVTNEEARTVLLLEGELLEGGWQHRTLVRDLLLAPHTARVVAVACVEQGRWSGSPEHSHGARRTSPSVRCALGQDEDTRQSAVWSRVGRYEAALGSSPTGSLLDHLDGLTNGVGRHGAALLPGQRGGDPRRRRTTVGAGNVRFTGGAGRAPAGPAGRGVPGRGPHPPVAGRSGSRPPGPSDGRPPGRCAAGKQCQ